MKIRSVPSVIILGIGVLPLTASLASAGPGGGQGVTPGNAMNPPAASPVVERDPEGWGSSSIRAVPPDCSPPAPRLVKEPSQTSGGLLYRMTVEFGGIGVGGDKDAAKFREYKDLDSGAYLNNFTLMLEKPKSAFHLDAAGGGVGRHDQFYVVDVGRYNTWRVRGWFSETPPCLHVDLPVAVGRRRQRRAHVEGPSPGRHHRREYDPGEHAPGDLVRRRPPISSSPGRRAGHASTSRFLRTGKPLPAIPGSVVRAAGPLAPSLAVAAVAATSRSRNRSTTTRRTCWQGCSSPTR